MANRKEELKARLMATFQVEAQEHLQALTSHLLALGRELPAAEAQGVIETTFREMHTLKGAARSVSLTDVEAVCQASEQVLSLLTRGRLSLSHTLLQHLEEAVDGIGRLLAGGDPSLAAQLVGRLERVVGEPAEAATPVDVAARAPVASREQVAPLGLASADTLRVAAAKLDALALQAEELLVSKLAAAERGREATALAEALAASTERAAAAHARELAARLVRDQRTVAVSVDGLLEETRRLRLTAAASILDLFPRMVRDLAEQQGKEADWLARGAELELDRKVLDGLKDPLIHLVRNAIDHGIEPTPVRAQARKPPRGRVSVTVASLEGGRIEIRVEDDGRGIDLAAVKSAAVRVGIVTADAAEVLSEEEALHLIYRSGLSTSPIITDVSGHGLGLAIVKERVERLGGRLDLLTRAGEGTTVRIVVPASIATFRGLLVRADAQPFLLPIDSVERALRVAPQDVETVEGRDAVRWNGRPLFLVRLSNVLELPPVAGPPETDAKRPCVVVRAGEERLGFLVEEIEGEREVLVKDLRPPLKRIRNVASAGLLGTGQVVLILRPADLVRAGLKARRAEGPPVPPEERRPLVILVVDDSITTRTMEKNLLEAAGYRVRVAVDGIDAWTALKSDEFDLVVSDVDMPRMDGFELTARVRADPKLAELPIVLVTALESREDKERGIEVGANAYVVKSSFDQSNLLEIIRRLA